MDLKPLIKIKNKNNLNHQVHQGHQERRKNLLVLQKFHSVLFFAFIVPIFHKAIMGIGTIPTSFKYLSEGRHGALGVPPLF
jgi:hypothetical protein